MGLCSSKSSTSGNLDRITAAGMSVDELYAQAFTQNDVEISKEALMALLEQSG